MPTLQQLQHPIDLAIIDAMIASTPDEWSKIVLEIEGATERQPGALSHQLHNPELRTPVAPSDGLYESTFSLDVLLVSHGVKLRRAIYTATHSGTDWQWKAEYAYA